ncbi:MAG: HEAT repeat domain-containing protein [Kiritimatiellaeota bacterium]|nr:HEAT repeat domain-containing protein [Kiritimatiellota bacterium]
MNQKMLTRRNGTWALVLAGGLFAAAHGQTEWQDVLKYDFGTCDAALTNIENQVLLATPAQRPALEEKLLGVLASSDATFPAKQYACRMLKIVGSEKSVPALAKLLTDEKLSHAARIALEALPGDAAGAALRDALGKTSGKLQIGVIGSLGARGDRQAIPALGELVGSSDANTARAAIRALARIGTAETAKALETRKIAKTVELCWFVARLTCADQLAKDGDTKLAKSIYEDVLAKAEAKQMRVGAFLGLVRLDPKGETTRVIAALKGDDPVLDQAVVPALLALPPKTAASALTKELPSLTAEKKIVALRTLSAIPGISPFGEDLNGCLNDATPAVQLAAVEAAVQLGNAQNIATLVTKLADDGDLGKAAKQALTDLQRDGVAAELIKAAGAGDPKLRVTVLAVLADRRDPSVLPALYTLTEDKEVKVRRAATKSIGTLGGEADVAKLVGLLLASKDSGDRDSFASATSAIAARQPVVETRAFQVIAGLEKAHAEGKVLLLGVLSALGGKPACEAVRVCLASMTPDVRKAAVKAFAEWPDAMPLDHLKIIAKEDASDINRILAMRGYIRELALVNMKPDKRLAAYKEMFALAARPEERRAVFAGLTDSPSLPVLQFLEGHLKDEGVKAEALTAYEKIAEELIKPKKNEAKAALERVIAQTDDKNLRKRAENALKKIK